MSEEYTRIETMLANVIETSDGNSKKLDAIIERNAKADTKLALISQDMAQHHKDDDDKFKKIDKKHSLYDKFIIGVLIFAITELIFVIHNLK